MGGSCVWNRAIIEVFFESFRILLNNTIIEGRLLSKKELLSTMYFGMSRLRGKFQLGRS
jgi:hypothetical protein